MGTLEVVLISGRALATGCEAGNGPVPSLTPLCRPQAVTGCEDCLAALLDHDAFVLCRDFKGRTPIHLASACGHTAVLRTLLQAALSTDPLDAGVDYSGYSPMHWASYTGAGLRSWRVRESGCSMGEGRTEQRLRPCGVEGGTQVKLHPEVGCPKMAPDRGGLRPSPPSTALPFSCSGHEDCLELLLEHSPFSYLEGNPFTPLHCAV